MDLPTRAMVFILKNSYYASILIWLCYDYSRFLWSNWNIFIKIRIFCRNITFDPPGCLCMDFPPRVMVFFRWTINMLKIKYDFCYDYFRFWGSNLYIFFQNTHILPKMSHLTTRGAYVWTYPLRQWYLFWRTLNMLQF